MSLETLLTNLTLTEKLDAMDLLWRDLSRVPTDYESPPWHGRVISDRLANPSDGPRLELADALKDVQERLHARRTQS